MICLARPLRNALSVGWTIGCQGCISANEKQFVRLRRVGGGVKMRELN